MRKIALFMLPMAILSTAWNCGKNEQPAEEHPIPVTIAPIITKVSETSFDYEDSIGLTIERSNGTYVTNEKLTYRGSYFYGSLNWYNDQTVSSTLKAYYPYQSSVPTTFSVKTDQTSGISSSDFVSSVETNVFPTKNAVPMVFKHRMSRLFISVINNSSYQVNGITIKGAIPSAKIGNDLTASVNSSASSADIKAYKASAGQYYAVIPPQKVALTVCANLNGKDVSSTLTEAQLEAGKQYSVSITLENETLQVIIYSEVENWTSGGTIPSNGQTSPVTTNTIYYGFGNSAQYVYENGLKKENATSAMGRYKATCPEDHVKFWILIPSSMEQPNEFTMGGAPAGFDIESGSFNQIAYTCYKSYGTYSTGVEINVLAQE